MDGLRGYLLGLIAAAMVCAVVVKLPTKGTVNAALKLLAGLFMSLSIISPLLKVRFSDLDLYLDDIRAEAGQIAADGENAAKSEIEGRITQAVRSYILDKAGTMGVALEVEVEVHEFRPCAVTLTGPISPYAKGVLADYIASNLGIGKEEQTWIS